MWACKCMEWLKNWATSRRSREGVVYQSPLLYFSPAGQAKTTATAGYLSALRRPSISIDWTLTSSPRHDDACSVNLKTSWRGLVYLTCWIVNEFPSWSVTCLHFLFPCRGWISLCFGRALFYSSFTVQSLFLPPGGGNNSSLKDILHAGVYVGRVHLRGTTRNRNFRRPK
jgi:hypothetical protein